MIALAVASGLLALLTKPAPAQQSFCDSRQAVLDWLRNGFAEFPTWIGNANGAEFIMTRADAGNWTIIVVREGKACLVASGDRSRFDKGT